jgi:hypothetical protein
MPRGWPLAGSMRRGTAARAGQSGTRFYRDGCCVPGLQVRRRQPWRVLVRWWLVGPLELPNPLDFPHIQPPAVIPRRRVGVVANQQHNPPRSGTHGMAEKSPVSKPAQNRTTAPDMAQALGSRIGSVTAHLASLRNFSSAGFLVRGMESCKPAFRPAPSPAPTTRRLGRSSWGVGQTALGR